MEASPWLAGKPLAWPRRKGQLPVSPAGLELLLSQAGQVSAFPSLASPRTCAAQSLS